MGRTIFIGDVHGCSEEFQELLQDSNFGKLYTWAIEKVTPAEENELLTRQTSILKEQLKLKNIYIKC